MEAFNFNYQFCKQTEYSLLYHIYMLGAAPFIYLSFLKYHSLIRGKGFVDISTIDDIDHLNFRIKYIIQSLSINRKYLLTVALPYKHKLLSIQGLFAGANWAEREVWDMFGIFHINHPDLRRILTDYGFNGNPLKKEFPVSGYVEFWYDDQLKAVRAYDVELVQIHRI